MLSKARGIADGCIDGLYLDGARDLIGVQNCVHDPGRLVRLRLSAQSRRTSGAFDPGVC